MNDSIGNERVPFSDENPTRVEMMLVPKKEYERLKSIVREGETNRIKSRNRIVAVFAMILMFAAAGIYIYLP